MEYGRTAGPYSSIAGNWIDSKFPICPFCKKLSAWEIAYGSKLSRIAMGAITTERYFFRCQHCKQQSPFPWLRY